MNGIRKIMNRFWTIKHCRAEYTYCW